MGAVTRLDPNTTNNLANQPGTNPGGVLLRANAWSPLINIPVMTCILADSPVN